jgi:hypothetical protein
VTVSSILAQTTETLSQLPVAHIEKSSGRALLTITPVNSVTNLQCLSAIIKFLFVESRAHIDCDRLAVQHHIDSQGQVQLHLFDKAESVTGALKLQHVPTFLDTIYQLLVKQKRAVTTQKSKGKISRSLLARLPLAEETLIQVLNQAKKTRNRQVSLA